MPESITHIGEISHKPLAGGVKYGRVLLKMSGEALLGDQPFGIDTTTVQRVAQEIKSVVDLGVEVCVVLGGGNIFRGVSGAASGMERVSADYIGMLGTIINALAMQNALENLGIHTRVQSAIPMEAVCEPYIRRRAIRHMEKGRVVIFAAGLGTPYFTTDTPAALRAAEMNCDALIKATKVDGVYDRDPKKFPDAKRFDTLSYQDVLSNENINVMDASAISLAKDNNIPVLVLNIHAHGAFARVMHGEGTFTVIK